MYEKDEIMEKIHEAQKQRVDDFEFKDHEGERVEVHMRKIKYDDCFNNWFWL